MKTKHHLIMLARSGDSGGKTLNNPVHRRLLALGLPGILFIAVSLLLPFSVKAECLMGWDVSGKWSMVQQSGGPRTELNLSQNENKLYGDAVVRYSSRPPGHGIVDGTLTGKDNYIHLVINWDTEGRTTYVGIISPDGRIFGGVIDPAKQDPATKRTAWTSSRAMKCLDEKPVGPPNPPMPQAEQVEAGISATIDHGSVTLTWNAGAGHPNAEVWVRVNDHEEKLLFTGAKGTQTVTVKPGKKYLYILRDGGQQLDTAKVKAGGKQGRNRD